LRYGIERLLFESLLLASESLTLREYRQAIRNPKRTKKMLESPVRDYTKLTEFTKIVVSLDSYAPPLHFWSLDDLFRYWGAASKFLHFAGPHAVSYSDVAWIAKAIARLDSVLNAVWTNITGTIGNPLMKPSQMPPEVRQAWAEFKDGALSKDDLIRRLKIMQPALQMRRGETGWQPRGRRILNIPTD
jgi:hypothetical protein